MLFCGSDFVDDGLGGRTRIGRGTSGIRIRRGRDELRRRLIRGALLRPIADTTMQGKLREQILEAYQEYEERAAIAS